MQFTLAGGASRHHMLDGKLKVMRARKHRRAQIQPCAVTAARKHCRTQTQPCGNTAVRLSTSFHVVAPLPALVHRLQAGCSPPCCTGLPQFCFKRVIWRVLTCAKHVENLLHMHVCLCEHACMCANVCLAARDAGQPLRHVFSFTLPASPSLTSDAKRSQLAHTETWAAPTTRQQPSRQPAAAHATAGCRDTSRRLANIGSW